MRGCLHTGAAILNFDERLLDLSSCPWALDNSPRQIFSLQYCCTNYRCKSARLWHGGEGRRGETHGAGSVTKSGRSERSSVGGNKLLMSPSDSGREGKKAKQRETGIYGASHPITQ